MTYTRRQTITIRAGRDILRTEGLVVLDRHTNELRLTLNYDVATTRFLARNYGREITVETHFDTYSDHDTD